MNEDVFVLVNFQILQKYSKCYKCSLAFSPPDIWLWEFRTCAHWYLWFVLSRCHFYPNLLLYNDFCYCSDNITRRFTVTRILPRLFYWLQCCHTKKWKFFRIECTQVKLECSNRTVLVTWNNVKVNKTPNWKKHVLFLYYVYQSNISTKDL